MDMNIDVEEIQQDIQKISYSASRMMEEIDDLRSSLSSAASGFQSENYDKVEAAVNQSVAVMNNMVNNLEAAQSYINELIAIAEGYLKLKY